MTLAGSQPTASPVDRTRSVTLRLTVCSEETASSPGEGRLCLACDRLCLPRTVTRETEARESVRLTITSGDTEFQMNSNPYLWLNTSSHSLLCDSEVRPRN